MFVTRLISGIVLLMIAIFAMSMGNVWLILPLALISLAAYRELTRALGCATDDKRPNALELAGLLGVVVYYGMVWLVAVENKNQVLLLACIMYVFMAEMLLYVLYFPKYHDSQVLAAFFSFLYAPVMLSFVFMTRELNSGIGFYIVWLILISSWGCDTCAYAVGVLIGKHKIFPVLSPKKSLEGCIGGVAGAALIGGLYGYFVVERTYKVVYPYPMGSGLESNFAVEPILHMAGGSGFPVWAVFAFICAIGAVMSMVGDLAASAIKRNHQIKDYGKIIPGHGGIMDRFDSMIVTAPMTYFLAIMLLR